MWAYSPVLAFLGEFVTLASIVIPIHLLLWLIIDKGVQRAKGAGDVETPAAPGFLQRIADVRIGDVLALKAEEHYVRVFSEGAGSWTSSPTSPCRSVTASSRPFANAAG